MSISAIFIYALVGIITLIVLEIVAAFAMRDSNLVPLPNKPRK